MNPAVIRPLVICLFKNKDSILVAEGFDSVKKEHFYRPIGGGIEFGESSSDALKREVKEEIRAVITDLKYLGMIESIFAFNGEVGHEIVMVYDAKFIDAEFYRKSTFMGKEDDGTPFKLFWKPISEFQSGNLRLVPENLLNLIIEDKRKNEL
ncbi:MAG: NUDIX domain-containing protein [Bacillota bacterium]|nr:NUDIX domain-containing protein [Bacillota bacterium]